VEARHSPSQLRKFYLSLVAFGFNSEAFL